MTERARQRRYHHGDVRNSLLNAARELIRERRSTELSMRELVDRVGVTQAAIYRHIDGKAELMATLCLDGFALYEQAQQKAIAEAGPDPWRQFIGLSYAHFTFALENPDYFRVMFGSRVAAEPEITPRVIQTFHRVVAAVEACQRKGLVVGGNAWDLTVATWGVFHGMAMLFLDGTVADRPNRAKRLLRVAVAVLERGLRPPPGGRMRKRRPPA